MSTNPLTSVHWRRSSRSNDEGGQCVELADLCDCVGIRDSKDRSGPVLAVGRGEFSALLNEIKAGRLDRR